MVKSLKNLFDKWELVYTSTNVDKHFEMVEKLRTSGVDYKTKGLNFGGGYGGAGGFNTIYHIYVRKGEDLKADDFIHHS